MGRRLGNALIIYGIINWFFCLFLGVAGLIGGTIWLIILIVLGKWQRDKAVTNERLARIEQDREYQRIEAQNRRSDINVNLTNQIANQPKVGRKKRHLQDEEEEDDDVLADRINKILDEREGKGKDAIRYTKD